MYDVIIIGAGISGSMISRELSKYKLSLCVLEANSDVAMGATKANSAIVHAGYDAKEGSLKARFNVEGSKMYEELCKELGAKYKRIGALVVGFNDEDKNTLEGLLARGQANGVDGLELITDRKKLEVLEPNIGDAVSCALYAPSSAITCPYELCIAAMGNAMDNGVELRLNSKVENIERISGGFKLRTSNGDELEAAYIINCAGVFSDEIAKMIGDDSFSITARRGEYVLLDKTEGETAKHTIFRCPSNMGKGILVSPTVDGNLLLGPTAENMPVKDDKTTSIDGQAAVKTSAMQQLNGIDLRKSITSFAGLRSVGDTGDFIIGFAKKCDGTNESRFINVAGIESPGLSAAPAIAKYVVGLLEDAKRINSELLECDSLPRNESFDPIRKPSHWFSSLSMEEKNKYIKEHPEYGHIICRCETVTEGEILEALRTNPKPSDLDGIKRRTRAQMGRCQGGFCSPYIVDIISKELRIDALDVTKCGGGSKILVGKTKAWG